MRNNWTLRLIISLLALFAGSDKLSALTYQPVALKEFHIPGLQKNLIENSGPVERSVLASDGSLWLLTTSTLWRWYPLTGVVQKINPGSDINLSGSNRALGTLGDGVYVAVDDRVWRFSTGTGNVELFAGTLGSNCNSHHFWGEGDFFVLTNDCGIWQVDRYAKSLHQLSKDSTARSWTDAVLVPACKCLWVVEGRELKVVQKEPSRFTVDDRYEAKSNLSGISILQDQAVIWTPYALLVFDSKSGRRVQVVPSSGQRRIASAAFLPDLHTVLFDDGTLEWMAPKSKKAWTSRVSVGDSMRIELDPGGAFALVHSKGAVPIAINLEPFNLTSP